MSTLKKVFIFSSLGLALLLFFGGIYLLLFKPAPKKTNPPAASESPLPAEKKSVAAEKMAPLSDEPVLAPTLNEDGSALKYYSRKDQGFYELSFDGQIRTLILKKELPATTDILWSPGKNQALLKISAGSLGPQTIFFDFATQKETRLSEKLGNPVWQNSQKIIYRYFDPAKKELTLNLANPDGTHWKKLADLDFSQVFSASLPQSGSISFWKAPDAYEESTLYSVSPLSTEKKIIFQGKFGANFLWNSQGSLALVSHTTEKAGKKMQLALINNNGGEYKNLEIPTLISKCAWSKDGQTVYYALPGSIPENAILPNDYYSQKFFTADTFWKVNVLTGEKTRLIDLNKISAQVDAKNLFLSPDEGLLFFVNRVDGKLYRISL